MLIELIITVKSTFHKEPTKMIEAHEGDKCETLFNDCICDKSFGECMCDLIEVI